MENVLDTREGSAAGSFDSTKRDSNVSMSTQSSGSSYHRFSRPFFCGQSILQAFVGHRYVE